MLEGSYSDVTGEYRRGDVQDVDEEVEHQPVVGEDGHCICLIASDRPARFKSLVGRITQPWTGL
jgi:putative transcriptional regulator